MIDPTESQLRDEAGVAVLITDLAAQIQRGRQANAKLVLIGVRTRGVPIAERIASQIRATSGEIIEVGAVDITLYRDDLGRGNQWPILKGTEIDFPIDEVEVVLVDDVLYTGRTIRAAMNCVCDLGRPSAVRLAVLVDRGGHELPIRADYVGLNVAAAPGERVGVRIRPHDPADRIVRKAPRTSET